MGERKYFLDWIRILAFFSLILFHVGMLYVIWPFNLKSPRPMMEIAPYMTAIGAFHLPLMFFISGVASRFLIDRLGSSRFAIDRVRRIFTVILVAMFVVIPPQTYIELIDKGVWHGDYLSFWFTQYLPADQTLVRPLHKTMPTWDHLWFIVYLFNYSLVFAALFALRNFFWPQDEAGDASRPHRIPIAVLVVAPAIWIAATNLLVFYVFPETKAFAGDWGAHLKWIGMFALGIYCAGYDAFWDTLRRYRYAFLAAAIPFLILRQSVNDPWWTLFQSLYAWPILCAVVGFAATWLNRPSKTLTHLTEAVLPVYVLHQPILLFAAYYIFPLHLPLAAEPLVIAAVTAAGCFLIYEVLIRPFAISRFLFGVKLKSHLPLVGRSLSRSESGWGPRQPPQILP
jgi:hypothetical protein